MIATVILLDGGDVSNIKLIVDGNFDGCNDGVGGCDD